jgi:hypothetical protein
MGTAVSTRFSGPATSLSRFCSQVARTYRIDAALGYPANLIDLKQYMTSDSETYFPWIADTFDEVIRDDELRLCNHRNLSSWRRVLPTQMDRAEPSLIGSMITVLESERLLIEHGCAQSAFCFCERRSGLCESILSPAAAQRPRGGLDPFETWSVDK